MSLEFVHLIIPNEGKKSEFFKEFKVIYSTSEENTEVFLRFYQKFLLLSNTPKFEKNQIYFYGSEDVKISFDFQNKNDTFLICFHLGDNKKFKIKHENKNILMEIKNIISRCFTTLGFHKFYRAIKVIGKGSFGTVILAKNLYNRESYAIKAISKAELIKKNKGFNVIDNEIKIMRLLDHPNIIKFHAFYETDNTYYMILELITGGNLKDYIHKQGKCNEQECAIILRSLLKSIIYLNENEIMHRDIKPDNILFRKLPLTEESIVLADFGLSVLDKKVLKNYYRGGTPGFVAPEVINYDQEKEFYSNKCDLYSIGITFYYMLFGTIPFEFESLQDLLSKGSKGMFSFCKGIENKISKQAKHLLSKLLIHDPESRFSAEEALNCEFLNNSCDLEENLMEEKTLFNNISEFNKRKISFSNCLSSSISSKISSKNNLSSKNNSPDSITENSPKLNFKETFEEKKFDKKNEFVAKNNMHSFVMNNPALNGNLKTYKSINKLDDEDLSANSPSNYSFVLHNLTGLSPRSGFSPKIGLSPNTLLIKSPTNWNDVDGLFKDI